MTESQYDLFDARESEHRKQEGMRLAAMSNAEKLQIARKIAREIATITNGTCTADQVGRRLNKLGIDLGPAAGSVFKTSDWVFTGRRVNSHRKTNHARELKVWALK